MAPTTRLRERPSLRVNYRAPQNRGTREHPFVITNERSSANPFMIPDIPKIKLTARSSGPLTRSAGITKIKAPVKALELKQKLDCDICAHSRSYKLFSKGKGLNLCEHMKTVCMYCVEKLVKGLVDNKKLGEARLSCLDPNCEHALSFEDLKLIVRKDAFETWDAALAQHQLRASDQYIACLNAKCGHHFSIEYCNMKTSRKKKIACPYCEYELCIDCNRPWHPRGDCDKNKTDENEKSEAAIKSLGAKPCPKCGVNIDKISGCDHMTCNQCGHHFCWECFITYNSTMQHANGCRHGRQNVTMDLGNFYNGPMDEIANLMAGVFHGAGQGPAPAAALAPQNHIHRRPEAQMPDLQNEHAVGFGGDFFNHADVQVHNGGVGGWNVNVAFQRLQAQLQGDIRGNGPDHAAPLQALWQWMGGNAAPARQVPPPIPVPQPILQPIAGNAAPIPAPIPPPPSRHSIHLRAARRLDA